MRRPRECPGVPAAPRITTAMIAVAFSIANCPKDAEQCGRILADLVLEAAEGKLR